jgi:hypothetical protein
MADKKNFKLTIIHLGKNIDLRINCEDYIILGPGTGFIEKGNRIFLTELQNKFFSKLRSLLTKKLYNQLKKNNLDSFLEYEITNIRNDKIKFFDCILNCLLIKKIIRKKGYETVELITDNEFSSHIFNKLKIKNLILKNFNNKNIKILLIFSFLKFNIKILCIKLFIFFFKKNNLSKNKDISFNMFPNFYTNEHETFFDKKNFLKLNFLLTDETHLSHGLYKIFKIILNSKKLNIINLEQFITLKDIKDSFINFLSNYAKFKKIKKSLIIENLDFSYFYKEYLKLSFLNRSKLQIYNSAIKIFLSQTKPIKIHMYMFEYAFGFYLINQIKKNFNNIEIVGYQHGIFSEKLLWLDILKKNKLLKNYSPDKIISLNNSCKKTYMEIYGKNVKKYCINLKLNQSTEIINSLKFNGKKNIFFPGTHDANDLVQYLDNLDFKEKKNFILKLHPKTKLKNYEHNLFLKNKLNKINVNKVFLSPTSTLVYQFKKNKKRYNIFKIDYIFDITNQDYVTTKNIINF